MKQLETSPPWVSYPGFSPSDKFWRQEGEIWALEIWLPFWSSLNEAQRQDYLKKWDAPTEWQAFYDPEVQACFASEDGPTGWVLRNNLTPCDPNLHRYISVTQVPTSRFAVLKNPMFIGIIIGILIVITKHFWFK